ncbi:hypothetical protein C3L33_18029, partial [Rhododendron williamsianum]
MVANERYIVRIPDNLPLDAAGPLLCAGITTYSPLRYFGLDKPGMKVGVVGLGGLGHVAVKFAKAFGAVVTVISTSPSKKQEAIEVLGADSFLVSSNPDEMQAAIGTLDGIIDTVSAVHALVPLLFLLKSHGKIIMVGAPDKPLELPVFPLIVGRKTIAGSGIGGMKETQEMIDFAGKHNIVPQIEVIPMDYVNTAMERLAKADVKYRFVLDSDYGDVFRVTKDEDVSFKILYCGICHTDLHFVKNDWGNSTYPLLPGHEVVGVVTEVGSKVQKYKVGDRVGVGGMVGACHTCESCENNLENYCPKMILTYNAVDHDGTKTYGGYSDHMVANERYIVRIPDNLPLDAAAPLLCAGITTYSALRYFGLDKPGTKVGVVGLGGLGHVAVKFAKAFGAMVTVISTSPSKKQEAIEDLGADSFLVSSNQDEMQAAMGTLDGIIDTVSAVHALVPLLFLLKSHGKIIMVGAPEKPLELPVFPLIMGKIELFQFTI